MAEGDGTLTPDDALEVLEELLPAQNKSFELGLALRLPLAEVEAIHSTYSKPRSRLLQVIIAVLKEVEPALTWRVTVDAIRSPAVNLPHLARTLEVVHFPDNEKSGLTVQCNDKEKAPCKMTGGSTTSDQHFAYFTPYDLNDIYSYQWSTEKWEQLPPCPHYDSALVTINGELTAVGGEDGSYCCTKKLVTLRQRQWVEEYPPMNIARSKAAVVSTSDGEFIIVIGGYDGGGWITSIELFQVSSRRWYAPMKLPQPLPNPSATICGNQLHVIGHDANGYSCSLQALDLLSSDRPIVSQSIPDLISWTSLPRLPVTYSTAATLYGQLVIIGGSSVNSIHQLLNLGQWVEIGSMSRGRSRCLVVSPSPDKMMIVGGRGGRYSVEECFVKT